MHMAYPAAIEHNTQVRCRCCAAAGLPWLFVLKFDTPLLRFIMFLFLFATEAPPALQSLRSPTQVVPPANQPMQQSYRMQTLGSFDDEPAIITCTQCRATGQTYTHKVPTGLSVYACTGT